jgi:hypothetical protein
MPYLLQEPAPRGIWNVALLHVRTTPYALNRFIHAHLAPLIWFKQKLVRLRAERSVADC